MSVVPTSHSAKLERAEWLSLVADLLADVEKWARKEGWDVRRDAKQFHERSLGAYSADVLTLQTPQGRLVLEPIARSVVSGEGRVDLYSWPSLHRVWLVRRENRWVPRTESAIDWPKPWNQRTFVELANALTAAA